MAINLLGLPRATEDLDIFVAPEPDNIERLKKALQSVYPDDPSIEEITVEDLLGDYPAVQYVPPDGNFFVDILTRLGEAFRYEDIFVARFQIAECIDRVAESGPMGDGISEIRIQLFRAFELERFRQDGMSSARAAVIYGA